MGCTENGDSDCYESPQDRAKWTPAEWADLLGSDLQGLLETRDLSKASRDEIHRLR
jgi:hypothetical protein